MRLLEFLADLATDTELMSAFRTDPQAALRARGLSETDQLLLLSGDPIALRSAVAAQAASQRQWIERSPGPPSMEMFPKPTPEPGPMPEEFPAPPRPMPEEFPPPKPTEPGPMPEEFPTPEVFPGPGQSLTFPSQTMMEMFGPAEPDAPNEPQEPDDGPEASAAHDAAGSHEAESMHYEPIDLERDLAQDAVLTGLTLDRAVENGPSGVWSGKGLTVVGMGMRAGLHMTIETRLAIEKSARVLYLVADAVSEACIRKLNPAAEALGHLYQVGKPRIEIYETIIARILGELETHGDVCVAFYGHPGVLTYPAWESIRRARATGKRARMLPAISTEDSLFADLGIDIGRDGLQSFEATRFLYYRYNFDPCAGLLLWQVSVLGENEWNPPHTGVRPRLEVLAEYLERYYAPEHEVYLYHAPEFPTSRALVERVRLRDLPRAEFVSISTLYVPPAGKPERNEENIRALARATMRK